MGNSGILAKDAVSNGKSRFKDIHIRLLYLAARPLVTAAYLAVCRRQVVRAQRSLPSGPVIVVSNHVSNFDIPLVGLTMPRRVSFMGKEKLFAGPLGLLFRGLGGFAVRRGRVDRSAYRRSCEVLARGEALAVFPEGGRSRSFKLMKGRPGVAMLALQFDASIVPVGLAGTEKISKGRRKLPFGPFRRPLVQVRVGEAFKLPSNGAAPTRAELEAGTDTIMRRIAALLPESYRGAYGEANGGS